MAVVRMTPWMERLRRCLVAAEVKAALTRRNAVSRAACVPPAVVACVGEKGFHASWHPAVASATFTFDAFLVQRAGADVVIETRTPAFAWLRRLQPVRLDVECRRDDGWTPRLFIDGNLVVPDPAQTDQRSSACHTDV